MDSPDRAIIVELFDEVIVHRYLASDEPDPTPDELAALEPLYARQGGVAHARVVQRWWTGFVHYTEDQLAALAGGDSAAYD